MEASEIKEQLEALAADLDGCEPREPVRWSVGKVANALLEQAKLAKPDNPVLLAIDPYGKNPGDDYIYEASAADVRAVLRQAAGVLPKRRHAMSIG